MQRIIALLIIASLGWYGYGKYRDHSRTHGFVDVDAPSLQSRRDRPLQAESPGASGFSCDGRTYCSQMTSCAEATFFLKNCPGTKMDGNNDGIPCERQWCN